MTETSAVRCEQFLAHPPEEVWRALTDPDLVATVAVVGAAAG
ncbi:MAG: hypothetical protein ACYC0E_03270 [Acidimicrobiales bacterium]